MSLGEAFEEANSAPKTAADDATLDIVRLLVETEARYVEAHVERQTGPQVMRRRALRRAV